MKRTLHMETLQNQIMAKLDLSREIEDGELVELIYQVLEEYAKDIYLPLRMKMEFGRDLFNAFRKLDILQELLEDESITEIMINGLENIFVEKKGEIYQYEKDLYPGRNWKTSPSKLPPAVTGQSMRRNQSWTLDYRMDPGSTWCFYRWRSMDRSSRSESFPKRGLR